jgi:tetratricopeptide (TPR) repeat protein
LLVVPFAIIAACYVVCRRVGETRRSLRSRAAILAACIPLAVTASGCASLSRSRLDENVLTARQLSLRGAEAIQQARWGDAEAVMSEAVRLCPLDERMRTQYAETLWNLNARADAIQHMQLAARLSGGNPELLVRLGNMHLEVGDLQLAWEQSERAIAANGQLASAWALRGDVLRRRGDAAESLASYHRALSYVAHYPHVQLAIADHYRMQGRHSRALATLSSLADGYPVGEVPAHVRYLEGLAQKELGRYEAAVGSFAAAIDSSPPSSDLLFQLAETRLLMGDPVNARIAARAALALEPNHGPSQQVLAHLDGQSRSVAMAADSGGAHSDLR